MDISRISDLFYEYKNSKLEEIAFAKSPLVVIGLCGELRGAEQIVIKILEKFNFEMKDELERLKNYVEWVETA